MRFIAVICKLLEQALENLERCKTQQKIKLEQSK